MEILQALGTIFNDVICYPLGGVLKIFFNFTQNYALLLVIFTLIIRFLLFPLAIKQQRSSAEMLRMKPKLDKIQKKYAKDQAKLQQEMSKLYQEEGYSPLSGCLPLVVQLPILYGLYQVVYKPLTFIMWFSPSQISRVTTVLMPYIKSEYNVKPTDARIQLYLAKAMSNHMDKLGFLGHVRNIDFSLFGIDLSAIPHVGFDLLILIPILCYITQALSSWMSVRMNRKIQQGQMGAASTNVLMTFLMPLMSVWLSVTLPAAVGFYWIISNLFMVVQVLILQKYFSLERLAAQAEQKAEKRREGIQNGTIKPSRMSQLTQRALGEQNGAQAPGNAPLPAQTAKELPEKPAAVKVNSKGNKSRSQLKDEQRKRLAKAREEKGTNRGS